MSSIPQVTVILSPKTHFQFMSVWKQEQHYVHCSKSILSLHEPTLGIAEWPLFSLACLTKPNHMSHLQDLVTVLLQLVGDASSGVAMFQISQLVAERN